MITTESQSATSSPGAEGKEAPKGFVETPDGSEFELPETEEIRLEALWQWREASEKSGIVLGEPLEEEEA
jgi:hypothetical protein